MADTQDVVDRLTRFYRQAGGALDKPAPWDPNRRSQIPSGFPWPAQVLAAAALLALVLGLGITFSNLRHPAPATRATPTPTAEASPAALGTELGAISLHMKAKDVLQRLGEPQVRTATHGMGSPQWEYSNGLVVYLRFPTARQDPDEVWEVIARSPFAGATAEGYRLGDSEARFRSIYRDFPITPFPQVSQLRIRDAHGLELTVMFGPDGSASWLILRDTKCSDCDPAPSGTPGPKKKPAYSNLTISGAMAATSRPDRTSDCGYRSLNSRLIFLSDPMPVGSEVVRVEFDISLSDKRVGAYDAVSPPREYDRTPLRVVKARSATAGAANGIWNAISGVVTVSQTAHLGEPGIEGIASGSIEADLLQDRGSPIHVSGKWSCVVDRGSNG